jgi:inosine-uridine nucleoside N-ribohydrolase
MRRVLAALLLSGCGSCSAVAGALAAPPATAEGIMPVILDTDCGFGSDDAMALLALLQSERVDLLGVTVVTGNDWLKQEVVNVLRLLEIAGRREVPVFPGAQRPLLTSREEMIRREQLHGETSDGGYKGAWRPGGPGPDTVVPPDGRFPSDKAKERHAADFIIETIRARPGRVVVIAIGPLTNLALALAKDPGIAPLARELVVMGGGIGTLPEFNFWMDPEAARLALRADWPRVTVTPINIARQAPFTREAAEAAASSGSAIGRYFESVHVKRLTEHPITALMYDQIAVLAFLEPSLIKGSQEMWLDVEIDHGPLYGATLHWDDERRPPPGVRKARVLTDLDYPAFMRTFLDLIKSASRR